MPKTAAVVSLPLRPRASGATRLRWLYDEIRLGIVEGRLAPGSRLPSTRSIARHYRVARGTVVAAFDHLIAEGYVEGSVGIGTFVRRTSPGPAAESCTRIHAPSVAPLSAGGQRLASHPFPLRLPRPPEGDFRLDFPALDAFSVNTWRRLAARALRAAPCDLLGHGEPLGYRPLRAAICGYFGQTRGVKCAVEQVVITGGTQQSLDLIARLVLDPGDPVWMEDPGYAAATSLLRGHGAEVIGVPVDEHGIDCEAGQRRSALARLAYVTPGGQFPLGVTLSLERRRALLQWALAARAWIFEDDYDSQLGFAGRPLVALQSLDAAGCVIYSNSFSKMLFPSLRLAALIVPPQLVAAVSAARSIVERFPPVLDQAILSEFIGGGYMEQHMRRMRELYTSRVETLLETARRELAGLIQFSPVRGGLQVVGWLAPNIDEALACRAARERGVLSIPLSQLCIDRQLPPAMVLGPASTDVRAIRAGLRRLRKVLAVLRAGVRNERSAHSSLG